MGLNSFLFFYEKVSTIKPHCTLKLRCNLTKLYAQVSAEHAKKGYTNPSTYQNNLQPPNDP